MKTGIIVGLIAGFIGVAAAASMAAKPSNMLVGETWRATYTVEPPVTDWATIEDVARNIKFSGFELVDVQHTATTIALTVRVTVASSVPSIGTSITTGGHTLTLVSAEKVPTESK